MEDIHTSLLDVASFTPLSVEHPNAWVGHLPFAAWLIKRLRPAIFVELGTHSGNSYFAFCQTVAQEGLPTKCYAVDTWKGEEHAGFYGEEVFHEVNAHNQNRYEKFSRLLRMTFDEAGDYFSDGSVDLLHIDGLHTYEAVRHDFETWFPKLAPGAIVLFHDINVRERGFGVWKLWEVLKERYPKHLEFMHSHGLGVLQIDNGGEKLEEWLQPASDFQKMLKEFFAALGERQAERYEINVLKNDLQKINIALTEKDNHIAGLDQALAEKDNHIAGLDQALAVKDNHIAELLQTVEEKVLYIKELTSIGKKHQIEITGLSEEIHDLRTSRSWRITAPLRRSVFQVKRVVYLFKITHTAASKGGGYLKTAKKTVAVLRNEGKAGIKNRLLELNWPTHQPQVVAAGGEVVAQDDYTEWVQRYDTLDDAARMRIKEKIEFFERKPLISIVMAVYDPPLNFLDEAIWSVRKQLYPHWEFCIADDFSKNQAVRDLLNKHQKEDSRIKLVFRKNNGHISAASNSTLEIATGEFIALLDNDGLLPEHALFWVAQTIVNNPNVDLIYSDEDKINENGQRILPFFKPDWSPHLAISQAYLGHLVCLKSCLVRRIGGWRTEKDGAQDYDLWLRASLEAKDIKHISHVLYHWRMYQDSSAKISDSKPYAHIAGLSAVANYLKQRYPSMALEASDGENLFTYKAKFNLSPNLMVSIVIPTRDRLDLLSTCIKTILKNSLWKNFEILIIDNGSEEVETLEFLKNVSSVDPRIRVFSVDIPFNWSKLNNIGATHCRGDVLIFLNNDIEILSPDWINYLAGYSILPDVGTVGGLLLFEDGTIQHAGVVVGMGGWADHVYRLEVPGHSGAGPFVSPVLTRNVLAVTGACMAISREKFVKLGGFDEEFIVCGSDVELGLRAHAAGYFNVMCAEVKLTHFESKTRTPHVPEQDFIQSDLKYAPYRLDKVDPFYNLNLSMKNNRPTIELETQRD